MKAQIKSIVSVFLLGCTSNETCPEEVEDTGIQVGVIDDACRCEEASLEIGSGPNQFVPIEEGEDVVMVFGPQGGWHIWGSIRAINTRDVVKIEFQVRDLVSDTIVVDVKNQVGLAMNDDCSGTYTGMFGFLDVMHLAEGDLDTPPELLCNHPIRMSMSMTDTGGRAVTRELDLYARPDAADSETCTAPE